MGQVIQTWDKENVYGWSCLANGASFGPSFLKLAWSTTHSCPCHRKVLGRWSFLLKVCVMPGTPASPSEITCPRTAMCCSSRIHLNLSRLVALAMWMTCWGHCWSRCALRLAHLSHVWTRWGMSWLTLYKRYSKKIPEAQIIHDSWVVRKFLGFVKMKCRIRKPSTVTWSNPCKTYIYHHIPSTYVHVSFLSVDWARLGFPNAYKLYNINQYQSMIRTKM